MKTATLILLSMSLLTGCAAPRPTYWVKPGGTEQEFNRTSAQCRMQAAGVAPTSRDGLLTSTAGGNLAMAGRDLQDAAASLGFMQDCLVAAGWSIRQ